MDRPVRDEFVKTVEALATARMILGRDILGQSSGSTRDGHVRKRSTLLRRPAAHAKRASQRKQGGRANKWRPSASLNPARRPPARLTSVVGPAAHLALLQDQRARLRSASAADQGEGGEPDSIIAQVGGSGVSASMLE